MTTVNLLVTPLEIAMIPIFIMFANYLGIYRVLYGIEQPSFDISAMMTSFQENKVQTVKDFADILFVAIIAWLLFVPIASFILYHAFKPIVSGLVTQFKKDKK
eukprot:CAMPEP_0197031524 /NCGR_PEP_ID=MMETSP1384-20130603/10512_1 /TAXON_ID=29189 /ORGANISM="Ammonia sp." /LENGTH=102 /DNA_ID=CAMNT_0042461065 /DNA_START=69 /DNA_END=377 /DNA_ORIENTATION=-